MIGTKRFYHNRFILFNLALICTVFLSGCGAFQAGGPAAPIGALQTLQGLQSVINGAPGTLALGKADAILMAWPYNGNYAFALIKGTLEAVPGMNGTSVNTLSFTETINQYIKAGWKLMPADKLPPAIIGVVTSYSIELIALGVQSLPTIFMVPLAPGDFNLPAQPEEIIT